MREKAKFELSAGGLVYKKTNDKIKILMTRAFGKWSLPKGVVGREKKENMVEAAKREIAEETGIKTIKLIDKIGDIKYMYRLRGKLKFKRVDYFLFEALGKEEPIPQEKEIEKVQWYDSSDAVKRIDFKNTKEIIEKGLKLIEKHG